ncbi:MAG TPA: HAMP domain-containing sensor histidine kinase [Ilumatobacter sp.]|nr:HAMP domain-containing sensor histidine kinase [Ilumatobacter sp.]
MTDRPCEHCVELAEQLATERAARLADAQAARLERERASADAGKLLRTVSHDVRTPLNNVFGALELAEMLAHRPADLARWLGVARASAVRLRLMLDDLVAHARNEAEVAPLDLQPVNILAAVRAATDDAELLSIAHDRSIVAELGPYAADSVLARPDELRQILVDLIVNALLHRSDGDVAVRVARAADDSVSIEVVGPELELAGDEQAVLNRPYRRGDEPYFASDGFAITVATRLLERLGSELHLTRNDRCFAARFVLPLTP